MTTSIAGLTLTQLEFTQTLDIEESVITYVLQNPDEIATISKYFYPQHFTHKSCQVIYKAAILLNSSDADFDTVQLIIQLEKNGQSALIEAGGVDEVYRLAMGSFSDRTSKTSVMRSIDFLIELDKRKMLSQKIQNLLLKIPNLEVPIDKIVELTTEAYTGLIADAKQKDNELAIISSSIEATAGAIIERTLNKRAGFESGIPTGWVDIDIHTGGWHENDLVIVGGRPGTGKSSFALSTCMEISKIKPVAFFSLEMDNQSMQTRCLSMRSGVNSEMIRDGKLNDQEIQLILQAAQDLKTLNYWGTDKFSPSIDFVVSECRKLAAKQGQLGAICIDYIQLMVAKQENSLNEVSDITRKLKLLAVELKCPIFGLSQLNRSVEARNDKRPIKSDLRDSGSLEQDADIILMLYRDVIYNPDTREPNVAEVIFRKHRNGQEGTVKLAFHGATTQFKNLAKY